MDIGKHNVDTTFYTGYEGEPEIVISFQEHEVHIWEGYFEDIFSNPESTDTGWNGFTRDYNELVNTFDDDSIECAIMPAEYLADLLLYSNHDFEYGETHDVLKKLIEIFSEAKKQDDCVMVRLV